MHQVLKID